MTERERENLGLELVAWLGSILAGPPGSAARFVDDPASLSIQPRWDAPHALTLVVTARGRAETGRCIGRHGAVRDILEARLRATTIAPGRRARSLGLRHLDPNEQREPLAQPLRERQRPPSRQAGPAAEAARARD